MSHARQHPFWGSLSPLGGLSGAGILIIASARLAWAITTAVGIFWVYGFSTFAFSFLSSGICKKFFPVEGRKLVFTCLSSFFGCVYLLLIWLICPIAAFEVFLPLSLVPLLFTSFGLPGETAHPDITESVSQALTQAAVLSGLLVAFSVIREPLAYCSLSLPGTHLGIVKFISFKEGSFFPIGITAASGGALLLLGYFTGLYQYCKNVFFPGEDDK
jgi:hypothetical protein